jgi:hypothetical protein
MFYATGHIFGGSEGVGSRFQVLSDQTRFRRYRGRRVPFSCFALPDSFSDEGVGSHFHVLRSRTRFQRYRGCRVLFSCFMRLNSFKGVTRPSGTIFMFYAPELVFGGNEGVGSRFHVLRALTHFRRYRGRQVPFSSFAHRTRFRG